MTNKIDIISIFPEIMASAFTKGIIQKAIKNQLINIQIHNLRDWTTDKHKITDDRPFGGGPGMVMKPEPIFRAVESLKHNQTKTILLSPQGNKYTQQKAQNLSKLTHLILICGRYEGVDQRVHEFLIDEKISIGNYVLSGGEIPALVLVDSITRLIPGVLGNKNSLKHESHSLQNKHDYPQYTHPRKFRNMEVPEILLTGNHQAIHNWRIKHTKPKSF